MVKYFRLIVVFLPETPVLALPGHVKHSEIDFAFGKSLNLETYCRSYLHLRILNRNEQDGYFFRFEEIYHSRFTRIVKPHYYYLRLLFPYRTSHYFKN